MYTIGMFSKINQVTTKTLRHYDEIGLLKPCFIDEATGYRYYDSAQFALMHKITSLKQMGFSLTEIMVLTQSACTQEKLTRLLRLKRQEINQNIREESNKLALIENFLTQKKEDFMNNYIAVLKELPECTVASMRQIIPDYNALFHLAPEVMGPEMKRVGCKCAEPAYCFNIYHHDEYKETDIDVELCEAVTEKKPDTPIIKFKVLPKVEKALSVLHKGPYHQLGKAYSFAFEWMEKNGYVLCGHPRESYIDGIWNKESDADWLTELQFPVAKA